METATAERPETALAESTGVRNPLVLLQAMIERGADPDALGKMMNLAERWRDNQAREDFNAAMTLTQAEMPVVVRDAENKHTRTKYALRETINSVIKPVYTRHGFYLSFATADCPLPEHLRLVVEIGHKSGDTRTRHFDIPLDGKGSQGGKSAMNAPQATGSTYSYGCRYATCLIFNVTVADEDNDGAGRGLTGDMVAALNDVIGEIRELETAATAAGKPPEKPFSFKRFLEWLNVKGLDEVPASEFTRANHELHRKRKSIQATLGGPSHA